MEPEKKFLLGQTIYSAQSYKIGRYVVVEYLTHESVDGVKMEYLLIDPTERRTAYSPEDIEKYFFATLEEAKELALQEWDIAKQQVTDQIENFTDKDFDAVADKIVKKKALQNQGK